MGKNVKILMVIFIFLFLNITTFALDLVSTPLRYELELNPWESTTKTAKIINREDIDLYISTWKSNLVVEDDTWKPIFVDEWDPNQELASWLYVKEDNFVVPALWEYTIEFDVNVPSNATPGWHYWVVYFTYDPKYNSVTWSTWWWIVNIKANYGVLVLVEVAGEIINWWWPSKWWTIVWWAWGTYYDDEENFEEEIDNCPYWDFSSSNVDWKCFDLIDKEKLEDLVNKIINDKEEEIPDIPLNSADEENSINIDLPEEDFWVDFSVPFENNWNTHVKPNWKITLYDENDNLIKWVWTENILSENWTIIWEKIVDYLPINQELWNVLPNSQRVFHQKWKWFPYESHDDDWKIVIKYWSPSDYYSERSKISVSRIYLWERINTKLEFKKIRADTYLNYTQSDWKLVEFDSSKDFYIKYKYEYIWFNPYFFICLALALLIIWFFWLLLLLRKKKCPKCKKRINKDMKICPYCWTKLKK